MKKICALLSILVLQFVVNAQIYLHDFGTTTISTHPYTVAPGTFDSNLSNSSWSNSNGVWTSFAGATGQAISLSNSSGTPTITLTFDVNPGCALDITAFDFWIRRSSTGAQNWSMTINGTGVGSGTVPTTGSMVGSTPVSGMTGLTGTVTIVISLSGASGTGTFRLDDFTLTGSTSCGSSNTITTGTVSSTPFSVDCAGTNTAGTVTFTSTGTFNSGNTYTVQLSDAAGSFTSATTIGTLVSTANSGTINISIPATTATGSGYLIRIISDNPTTTGSNSAAFTITQTGGCGPTLPASEGLIINEWSNGPSGNQEFYEFVVAGQCGTLVDIRGYILDDNNATFTNPADYDATPSGIAPGHFRFTYDPQWASIPVGSLIVVYNANEPNPALPADDPTDANNDSLYVVPHNSTLFESCTTFPATTAPDSTYSGCTYATALLTGWNPLSLRNSGDAIQVRQPDGTYYHGVSYGGSEMTGGPHSLKLFTGSGSGMCGWFNDGDFFDIANWSSGSVSGNETPGLPNNATNYAWLLMMRDTVAATCPITVLPVEMTSFTGLALEEGNRLWWSTATESNSSHFLIERSHDGQYWRQVGQSPATGFATHMMQYSFIDTDFDSEMNYYRLTEFDLNGESQVFHRLVAIDNSDYNKSRVVGRYNLMGQEVDAMYTGVLILLFEDGHTEKVMNF